MELHIAPLKRSHSSRITTCLTSLHEYTLFLVTLVGQVYRAGITVPARHAIKGWLCSESIW